MEILIAVVLAALADQIWGGQSAKYNGFVHKYRRLIAPALVVFGLAFAIGVIPALIAGLGYTAVRIMGWRFVSNGELFLPMDKPLHFIYAFIHGLGFCLVPVAAHLIYGSDLTLGVLYWAGVSLAMLPPWALIMFIGRKTGKDLLHFKEAAWGATYGAAGYFYFAYVITTSALNSLLGL